MNKERRWLLPEISRNHEKFQSIVKRSSPCSLSWAAADESTRSRIQCTRIPCTTIRSAFLSSGVRSQLLVPRSGSHQRKSSQISRPPISFSGRKILGSSILASQSSEDLNIRFRERDLAASPRKVDLLSFSKKVEQPLRFVLVVVNGRGVRFFLQLPPGGSGGLAVDEMSSSFFFFVFR